MCGEGTADYHQVKVHRKRSVACEEYGSSFPKAVFRGAPQDLETESVKHG